MLATKGARKKLLKELVPACCVHLKAKQPVSHKFSVVIRLIFVENRKRAVYRAERCSGGSKAGDMIADYVHIGRCYSARQRIDQYTLAWCRSDVVMCANERRRRLPNLD